MHVSREFQVVHLLPSRLVSITPSHVVTRHAIPTKHCTGGSMATNRLMVLQSPTVRLALLITISRQSLTTAIATSRTPHQDQPLTVRTTSWCTVSLEHAIIMLKWPYTVSKFYVKGKAVCNSCRQESFRWIPSNKIQTSRTIFRWTRRTYVKQNRIHGYCRIQRRTSDILQLQL